MKTTTIGIDLAKSVFSIYGVDEHGKCVLKRQVRREQLLEVIAKLWPESNITVHDPARAVPQRRGI